MYEYCKMKCYMKVKKVFQKQGKKMMEKCCKGFQVNFHGKVQVLVLAQLSNSDFSPFFHDLNLSLITIENVESSFHEWYKGQ